MGLPWNGWWRFVPPKGWEVGQALYVHSERGCVDRYGNVWQKPKGAGTSPRHWDVQLGERWLTRLRLAGYDRAHLNVTSEGRKHH